MTLERADEHSSMRAGTNLAKEMTIPIEETHRNANLDEDISLFRQALILQPENHVDRSSSRHSLATALYTRFKELGQREDLNEAISLHREDLALQSKKHSNRSLSLHGLAAAVESRFELTGDNKDLDEVVTLYGKALALQPDNHPNRSAWINDVATGLYTRFKHTGGHADLDDAVSLFRAALVLLPGDHPNVLFAVNNLAMAHMTRFEQTSKTPDVDEEVSLRRLALDLLPDDHPDRSTSLNHLATALLTRFDRTGQHRDLDEAISVNAEALALQPGSHPHRSFSLNNLAMAFATRFKQTGQRTDLDEAISTFREALVLRPEPHPKRPSSLNNLALALYTRFKQMGQPVDMDEAISLYRTALVLWPENHPDRHAPLSNLALILVTRFKQLGQPVDLDEAIQLHRTALALLPDNHPQRSISLNDLGTALTTRFDQMGRRADLDEMVSLHREAFALQPETHPNRPPSLNNLAMALENRFKETGQSADLDEAVSLLRAALVVLPENHPDRFTTLDNLAIALETRFKHTNKPTDLDEPIMLCEEAIKALPEDHPQICSTLSSLGRLIMGRLSRTLLSDDAAENPSRDAIKGLDTLRAATNIESAPVLKRFAAARMWCKFSDASDVFHDSALEAYETAIEILPRLGILGMDLASRQRTVTSKTDGLARDAAGCAIRSQRFEKAIEFLEAGRTIFWTQALYLRTPLDDLESEEPELSQKLRRLSRELEQGTFRDVSRTVSDPQQKAMTMEQEAIHYRQLSDEWLATLRRVRELDKFQNFLRPKSYATLSAAAYHGPIVILNAVELRSTCDALVVRYNEDPVHIPLPGFTYKTAKRFVNKIRSLPGSSFPMARGDSERHAQRFHSSGGDPDSVFRGILEVLWTWVVQPIFQSLHLEKTDSPPRLWWLPTGPFASLPVHAAGVYDAPGGDCVSDFVISSYTPTLSALLTPLTPTTESFKMVAVIQPITQGQESLPGTTDELRKIEKHAPIDCLVKFGIPEAPSQVEDIVLELPTASIVHFACHGVQNAENPLESTLLLEGRLEVSQIMKLDMPNASLVFLSACQTALVDDKLPDESIHLAATLLFSGFRGAVATMWSIRDHDGPRIADSFYCQLFSTPKSSTEGIIPPTRPDTTRAAHALHLAVAELRDKLHAEQSPSRFVRWVPFVHFGL